MPTVPNYYLLAFIVFFSVGVGRAGATAVYSGGAKAQALAQKRTREHNLILCFFGTQTRRSETLAGVGSGTLGHHQPRKNDYLR